MGRAGRAADSALEAGLIRRRPESVRELVLRKATERALSDGNDVLIFPASLAGKDVDGRLVQLELERLADEGVLRRRYQLGCPSCGEKIGKRCERFDELEVGRSQRCKHCRTTVVPKALDCWVAYSPAAKLELPKQRNDKADMTRVEKTVKKLLKQQPSFTASEIAELTGVPLDTVRPWLSWMIDSGDIDARETVHCRGCGRVLLDDPDEVSFKIGHVALCDSPDCGEPPFVITTADIQVAYVGERVHRYRRPSFDSNYPAL